MDKVGVSIPPYTGHGMASAVAQRHSSSPSGLHPHRLGFFPGDGASESGPDGVRTVKGQAWKLVESDDSPPADAEGSVPALHIAPSSDSRHLRVLFRRNPDHDGQSDRIRYEGYHMHWPDGGNISLSFQRFCQQGTRLLGLGRRMKDRPEQMIDLGLHPVAGLDAPLTRHRPGIRFRRFYVERQDGRGRLFFFNGSPTDIIFDVDQDDRRVLDWIGLEDLEEGEQLWFDLSAQTVAEEEDYVPALGHLAG